jgi:hypothetical protein
MSTIPFFDPQGNVRDVSADQAQQAIANGGERAVSFNAPDGKQHWVAQSKMRDALAHGGFISNPDDLTINLGEGTYKMNTPQGASHDIPYSMVESAARSGYRLDPSSRQTYVNDAAADPNLNANAKLPQGVKIAGRNAAGQPIYAPVAAEPEGSAVGRFLGNAANVVAGTASGLYHAVTAGPQNPEEARLVGEAPGQNPTEESPITGRVALIVKRLLADPAIQQGEAAAEELKQANAASPWYSFTPSGEAVEHREKAASHALAAAIPGVGPWVEGTGEQIGEKLGQGDLAGAAGVAAGNAAVYAAPHLLKLAKLVKITPRATLEAVTETSPHEIRDVAEDAAKENNKAAIDAAKATEDARKQYDIDKAKADHETAGREIARKYDVHQAAQEQAAKHKEDVATVDTHNERVWDKANKKYLQEVRDVREENQRTIDKYAEQKQRMEEKNTAAEHMLDMRRAEENALNRETVDYYAKEDEERGKAKDAENDAWQPWHDKMDDVPVDMGPVQAKLEPILKVSPEATRAIHQLVPDPADAEPDSDYGRERQRVMEASGYQKGTDYFKLPADKRLDIDKMVASSGFEPEPIDLDPKAGTAIPLKVIQRAQSIIGRNIAKGRYEGPLLGEMKQVQSTLRGVVTKVSTDYGTDPLLDAAREATRSYQEAFGKERPTLKTLDEIRQKGANPEEYKRQQEEERLAGAAKLSPDLVDAYRKVKARRDALAAMDDEDALRKKIEQIPPPPSVGDLRSGYNLKPYPTYEPPTVDDLRDGYRLNARPELPEAGGATQSVKEQDRVSPGPEPEPVQPEVKTISPKDYESHKVENIKKQARELRKTGLRRALYATLTSIPVAIVEGFRGLGAGAMAGEAAVAGLVAGATVLAGSHIIANLVARPEVIAWLSKITDRDVAMWQKLPPEQRALFTDDMKALVKGADKQKVPVSGALRAFASGTAASQQPSLKDLKKRAEELKPPPANTP